MFTMFTLSWLNGSASPPCLLSIASWPRWNARGGAENVKRSRRHVERSVRCGQENFQIKAGASISCRRVTQTTFSSWKTSRKSSSFYIKIHFLMIYFRLSGAVFAVGVVLWWLFYERSDTAGSLKRRHYVLRCVSPPPRAWNWNRKILYSNKKTHLV